VLFEANDGVSGRELWRSDGTPEGTWLVKDIVPGPNGSEPRNLTPALGLVFFRTSDEVISGGDLWRTDGRQPAPSS
jgi:ELWxxDGT repeat protein